MIAGALGRPAEHEVEAEASPSVDGRASLADRIGQPFAAEALGTSVYAWSFVLATGALLAGITVVRSPYGPDAHALPTLAWATLLAICPLIALVDARLQIIPNRVLAPAAAIVTVLFALAVVTGGLSTADALRGIASGAGAFAYAFAFWFAAPVGGYGWGDVKLTGLCGLVLGTHSVMLALGALVIVPPLLAIVPALIVAAKNRSASGSVPFGPFIATSVVVLSVAQSVS